ncbi:MAG: copper resistance system multicopper oxidase [Pseudomonadota bacterium]|nr:copper resistance system multicopper oxidase [Pseudomonadota bacterium]
MSHGLDLQRRQFVAGTLALGAATALPAYGWGRARRDAHVHTQQMTSLSGDRFELSIGEAQVNLTGKPARANLINGSLPAPTLYWREGDTVELRVSNTLREDTSIHWHGIILPANMDGVPGFSFHGIGPGESYLYRFTLNQRGTYWYHAHSSMQEAIGVYGGIVIEPREGDGINADRDHLIILSDWSDEDPHAIQRKLKIMGHYYNRNLRTVGDFLRDAKNKGLRPTLKERGEWGRMRMSPTDLADVTALTYTYLANGSTPAGNWTALFKRGEKVRLRFVNASAMTFFDVRIPGLKMTVIAADGLRVEPVSVDEFRIGVAETYDVLVEPAEQPYTLFAQAMNRGGYARATLSPAVGLEAPVPAMDKRALLTMADMGHDHGAMGHGEMKCGAGQCGAATAKPKPVPEMKCGAGQCGAAMQAAAEDAHTGHAGMAMINHPASESNNPDVDMQTMTPSRAIDDPGIGLRDNGRRVLTYADLKSAFPLPDPRTPGRDIELHLTGNMERYIWGFDGIPFSMAAPIRLNYGERVRIVLVNDTMMEHPIHLHGMWSDLENAEGQFQVRKHTINVPPGHIRSFRVTADALGRWAFHCHMLMHMEMGMFREVRVEA